MKPPIAVSLLTLAFLFSCTYESIRPDNTPDLRTLSHAEIEVAGSSNDFAFDLFRSLQGETAGNLFISPLSVSMALGMTLNGASGETLQGILNTIAYEGLEPGEVNQAYKDLTGLLLGMDKKVSFGLANSVWYRNSLTVKPAFAAIIKDYYDGKVGGLNFNDPGSKDVINQWVSDKTNDRIRNLIDGIKKEEVMFLVNTIYFKGDWRYQFDESKTKDDDFFLADGMKTTTKMMVRPESDLVTFGNERMLLADLPYGNGQFTMTVLLPREGHNLTEIVKDLTADSFSDWLANADTGAYQLEMPRFRMEWKKDLKDQLSSMGMATAFSEWGAEFPNFFEEENLPPLRISKVIHSSFIEVNEKGTEAAAATSVSIGFTSISPTPSVIKLNRPFLFIIRERHSGVILFIGQFTQPEPV